VSVAKTNVIELIGLFK